MRGWQRGGGGREGGGVEGGKLGREERAAPVALHLGNSFRKRTEEETEVQEDQGGLVQVVGARLGLEALRRAGVRLQHGAGARPVGRVLTHHA